MRKIDLTGKKFHRLTVLGDYGYRDKTKHILWTCVCDCGTIIKVGGFDLQRKAKTTKSCGCFRKESTRLRRHKHGHSSPSRTYRSWQMMKNRCTNPEATDHIYYIDRGISVCERWLESFEHFLRDMGERPEGTSIDRIDNDGNYAPSNCRWATAKEQANNKQRR